MYVSVLVRVHAPDLASDPAGLTCIGRVIYTKQNMYIHTYVHNTTQAHAYICTYVLNIEHSRCIHNTHNDYMADIQLATCK